MNKPLHTTDTRSPRTRHTARDWIELALAEIAEVGVKGLRVNNLCDKSGITKGSFYSHFRDKSDLLQQLIHYWSEQRPDDVLARLEEFDGVGIAKLDYLHNLMGDRSNAKVDLAIREWARFDADAARALAQTDLRFVQVIDACLREARPGQNADYTLQLARFIFVGLVGARTAPWVGIDLHWQEIRGLFAE